MEKYRIGKVYISRTTPEKTIANIEQAIKEERSEYICVSNVRTVAYANKKKKKISNLLWMNIIINLKKSVNKWKNYLKLKMTSNKYNPIMENVI